mgnify:CR=1 FL=1
MYISADIAYNSNQIRKLFKDTKYIYLNTHIIDNLRIVCYNRIKYQKRGEHMETTTIYRINETDRTIDIVQSVDNTDESIHGAVLNTRTFTFDELMNQHKIIGQKQ